MGKNLVIVVLAHCRDICFMQLRNKQGQTIGEYQGYVPKWLSDGDVDDVYLKIDARTGKILNWKALTERKLLNTFGRTTRLTGTCRKQK